MQAVACGFHDAAVVVLDRSLHEFIMPGHCGPHLVGELLPQTGAVFQVGKENCYGASGKAAIMIHENAL